jgi:glycosyltransferase involved in cell wall biosynthesis
MLFHHLKYVSPVWYFNLKPNADFAYFPNQTDLEEAGIALSADDAYLSEEARQRDLAYRAFQLGFINRKPVKSKGRFWQTPKLPAEDEYRFLRKNFSRVWVIYTLLIRIVSFKNPIREVSGFLKSKNARREVYHLNPLKYALFNAFDSTLVKSQPFVTVVIPTLNRYTYLKDVFRDLEKQTYKNFEVIVVDQTDPFDETAYQGWKLDLTYWYQKEKALWKARNEAIQAAKGEYILLYDDDSLVEPDWIEQHLKALDFFNADLSSGVSISTVGAKVPEHYSYFRWSDQLDTGNVLLKKEIFETIGLFDRQFEKMRMGDGEYGLRAYLAGYRNVSNPFAKRIHLKVGEGGLRQMGSWDGWRPKKFFGPRPVPSILYLVRKYYGNTEAHWLLLKSLPPSIIPYQFKANKLLMIFGSLLSILLFPLITLQVLSSWKRATDMLKEGAKIELLTKESV